MIKNFRYFVIKSVIIGLIIVLIFIVYMIFNQKNLIYFPDSQNFDNCPGFVDSEKVRFSGTRMYYLEAEKSNIVLVYYHGNAGSACGRAYVKDILKDQGVSLLFVEYAGYSGDTRDPSKDLIIQDVKNANEFIREKGYEKTVLMGTSLGTAVTAFHQTLQQPEKIILMAPFDKLSEIAKIHYPFIPINVFLREEYDSVEWLKNYTGKIVIIHGTEDEIIPIKLAKRLYESIPSDDKSFVTIEGANHNNLHSYSEVWEAVADFLNSKK